MPLGTNDSGRARAKSRIVSTVLIGYFWGELVPLGINDKGRAGTKFPVVGTALIGYFEGGRAGATW